MNGGGGRHLPGIFGETTESPIAQIHLRNASLDLLDDGQAQKKAGEAGAGTISHGSLGGVAVGKLVVAAIFKKAPHGPDIAIKRTTELETVTAALPCEGVTDFEHGVPGVHGSGRERVAHAGVTLDGKPGSAPSAFAAVTDTGDTELVNDVIDIVILRGAIHRKAREGKRRGVDLGA